MKGQNEVGTVAQKKIFTDLDAEFAQSFDLPNERHRIHHHAVANDADFATPKDSGWNEMQNVGLTTMNDGVAGIVPALAAHDNVGFRRQHVDDFPLPLISPLSSNQNRIRHVLCRR